MQAIHQTPVHVALNQASPINVLSNELKSTIGKVALLGLVIISLSLSLVAPSLFAINPVFGAICLTAVTSFVAMFGFQFGNAATRSFIQQSIE